MAASTETILEWVVTTVLRDGGQRGSRRNAWASMVVDNARARARAEAQAAVDHAGVTSGASYARLHGTREERREEGAARHA